MANQEIAQETQNVEPLDAAVDAKALAGRQGEVSLQNDETAGVVEGQAGDSPLNDKNNVDKMMGNGEVQ